MKKQFVWIGIAVITCLFVLGAWIVTHPGFAVGELQAYVARKTGRELLVKGGATLVFSPQLGIRLDDVSIANPMAMSGVFVNVAHVRLPITYADLFRRKLSIKRFTVEDAHFNFLVDEQGRSNWTTPAKSAANVDAIASAKAKEPLEIIIENGTANYLDERSGQAFAVTGVSGQAGVGADGAIDIATTAAINAQFAKVDAHIASLARVSEDGSPADIAIRAPALTLNFSGRLGTRNSLALVGTVDASSPDLHNLAKWMGNSLGGNMGLKNFTLSGAVDSSGNVFTLGKANIALDGMLASGALSADFSNSIAQISGTLSTDVLNLDPYLVPSEKKAATVDDWSTTAQTFSALKGVEGELAISAFKVKWHGAEWGPLETSIRLKSGVLVSRFQNAQLYGGTASATVSIDGSQDVPGVKLEFDGQNLNGETFFGQLAGLNWLTGSTALKTSLSTSGKNQQEMMSNLQGTVAITVTKGEIKGVDVLDSIASLGNAALAGWGGGDAKLTAFDSASASFAVSDGIATTNDIAIEAPQLSVTGKGDVDMLRRAVDLKFDPQINGGDIPVHVAVKGPWGNPKINPDVGGVDVKKIEKKGKKILKKIFGN
jgi:AsmA protein